MEAVDIVLPNTETLKKSKVIYKKIELESRLDRTSGLVGTKILPKSSKKSEREIWASL